MRRLQAFFFSRWTQVLPVAPAFIAHFVCLFVWLLLFLSFKTGQGFLISSFKLLLGSLKFFVLISELAYGGTATPGMNVGVEK